MNNILNFNPVLELIIKAGRKLKPAFGKIKGERYKGGDAGNIVTKLDIETEEFLASSLKELYPSIGFKGEESGLRKKADMFWLVDPIDGTGYFVRGIPGCTNMIALIDGKEVIFSAIYDFINGNLYHAQKKQGAYCNNKKMHVSDLSLEEGFLYFECDINKKTLAEFESLKKYSMVLSSGYPPGFEYAMVASGKIEGRINLDPMGSDYDYASGVFLVKEAGGQVANIGSNEFDYMNLNSIAANKKVYKALTKGENPIFPPGS
ncbi:hypothetical protein HYU94_01225 [Candidatus Daviesbacteria bacterium]|nr:hypothetical protein [Candidatus Daviesbacteria bacterium]